MKPDDKFDDLVKGRAYLPIITLFRDIYTDLSTMGYIDDALDMDRIYTIEPPDLNEDGIPDNEKNRSCIPGNATYLCKWLGKHGHRENVWSVKRHNGSEIPGRTGVLIHKGNYPKDTLGCILFGNSRDIVNHPDFVGNSGVTLAKFATAMNRQDFLLRIVTG